LENLISIEQKAIDILSSYKGGNNFILRLKQQHLVNKKFFPTRTQSDYIITYHNEKPKVAKKWVDLDPYFARKFADEKLFREVPDKIYVEKLLVEKEKSYHIWGKFFESEHLSDFWVPKGALIKTHTVEKVDIDYSKYSHRPPLSHQKEAIEKLAGSKRFILADDMGLGKTIQALTFLQHLKDKQGHLFALVVCPTTLMYNWENELKKFTPSLGYHIHHGSQRLNNAKLLKQHEVIITTYGTMRSDIRLLTELQFDSIILDESQAIKNPQSKVAKASVLLKGNHRICMSGTPLQNNTFDVYAQMNFLNPGMLGSIEHFRNDFATPIDKFGEQEQKEHLRRLLYPFILRRTKEQVAKDLPEKTETVLYCEMNTEQRKIYDAYRNEYRSRILGTIDEVGIGGSQLTILQGLMKLRQICDSPYILNEEEKLPNVSIKLEELSRELKENISNHKTLVFSQFLGMLALIREKLEEQGIPYVYFDGSTSAADREKAVRSFQENDDIRVFLISLKAGGVGLNLTAASYVFIVDPWWNPAVEQQAIDRTHRIGQTNNIFAYRMICKDTIEDKILVLQEKKRALAKDLISDDTGFVKSLSREDVEYLFS